MPIGAEKRRDPLLSFDPIRVAPECRDKKSASDEGRALG